MVNCDVLFPCKDNRGANRFHCETRITPQLSFPYGCFKQFFFLDMKKKLLYFLYEVMLVRIQPCLQTEASSLRGRKRRRISIGVRESFCGGSKYRKSNRKVEEGTPPRFYLCGSQKQYLHVVARGQRLSQSRQRKLLDDKVNDILTPVNLIVLTPQVPRPGKGNKT